MPSENDELLPCELCRSPAMMIDVRMSGYSFRPKCTRKGCLLYEQGVYFNTAVEAASAWNTRVESGDRHALPAPPEHRCRDCVWHSCGNGCGCACHAVSPVSAVQASYPTAASPATVPAGGSLNARCRRVWVCRRCGNCLDHCEHKNESNFREDLTMPCSVRLPAPTAQEEWDTVGEDGSRVTIALEEAAEVPAEPCENCGGSGKESVGCSVDRPLITANCQTCFGSGIKLHDFVPYADSLRYNFCQRCDRIKTSICHRVSEHWNANDTLPLERALSTTTVATPSDEAHYALHTLWTWAVDREGYDKSKWRDLEGAIYRLRRAAPSISEQAQRAAKRIDEHISERLDRSTSPQIDVIAAVIQDALDRGEGEPSDKDLALADRQFVAGAYFGWNCATEAAIATNQQWSTAGCTEAPDDAAVPANEKFRVAIESRLRDIHAANQGEQRPTEGK